MLDGFFPRVAADDEPRRAPHAAWSSSACRTRPIRRSRATSRPSSRATARRRRSARRRARRKPTRAATRRCPTRCCFNGGVFRARGARARACSTCSAACAARRCALLDNPRSGARRRARRGRLRPRAARRRPARSAAARRAATTCSVSRARESGAARRRVRAAARRRRGRRARAQRAARSRCASASRCAFALLDEHRRAARTARRAGGARRELSPRCPTSRP